MTKQQWQILAPIDAIVFDCDGTLSAIEGINELAKRCGVYEAVEALTTEAMARSGLTPALYEARLALAQPTKTAVAALGKTYYEKRVEDCACLIRALTSLGKAIYLLSAGLAPAVQYFGTRLQIPSDHIFAVDIQFNPDGSYGSYDLSSPLINNDGKLQIVKALANKHQAIVHVGDGLNDFVTQEIVARFIGYGGVFYRDQFAQQCDYYITAPSLAAILPLVITPAEYDKLNQEEQQLYEKGLTAITNHQVIGRRMT